MSFRKLMRYFRSPKFGDHLYMGAKYSLISFAIFLLVTIRKPLPIDERKIKAEISGYEDDFSEE